MFRAFQTVSIDGDTVLRPLFYQPLKRVHRSSDAPAQRSLYCPSITGLQRLAHSFSVCMKVCA